MNDKKPPVSEQVKRLLNTLIDHVDQGGGQAISYRQAMALIKAGAGTGKGGAPSVSFYMVFARAAG